MNILLLVLLVPLVLTIGTNTDAYALSDSQRWQSGYDHGCDDARGGGHAYLNTHPKHTKIFMGGYEDGYQDCKGQKILEDFMPNQDRSETTNNDPCDYYGLNVCDANGDCDNENFDCITDLDNGDYCTTGMCPGDDSQGCVWPECYYPTDDPKVGEDDTCRLPECYIQLD
jgi:hypothetical protein